ncbi:MAG: phenylacetate-CoA oxygenase subunit PaaC [Acidobacteriaceae bacterium]|nr:phenylacetate-CoA oxygenase subunit PaaC [Acidobacteriaceae bacterium]
MAQDRALFEFLLRMGDNCLVLSQRLSEWCGRGPVLEEDIALTNVALDLLGQARFWLSYAADVEGLGRDEDQLAYLRDAGEYRNVLLLEQPNGDYAVTSARQFYFDAWHYLMLQALSDSTETRVRDIAQKAVKEVRYHLERSRDWVLRLGDGTEESHRRMQAAVDGLWMFTGELFETDSIDDEMKTRGIGPDLQPLKQPWLADVAKTFADATLQMPASWSKQTGGKRGVHTEKLGYVLAEMQFLQRAYPGLKW